MYNSNKIYNFAFEKKTNKVYYNLGLMKKIILLTALAISVAYSQQLPQYTQYMLNPYLINPAVGGTTDHFDIKAGGRYQWLGFSSRLQDATLDYGVGPRTFYLTGHGHIGKDHQRLRGRHKNQNSWHHGLGFQVIMDRAGPTNHLIVQGSYSYDMSLKKNLRLSFGAFVGGNQWSIATERIQLNDGSSGLGVGNQGFNFNRILPTMSFGTWLYHKYWYAGISIMDLLPFKTDLSAYNAVYTKTPSITNRLTNHYYFTGGAMFHPNRDIAIIPSFLLKAVLGAPGVSVDINTKVRYKNMVWGGLSLRTSDAFAVLFGVLIDKKYEIGLSYDYTINSTIRPVSGGTVEFMLGYRIDPRAHVMSPSDFW